MYTGYVYPFYRSAFVTPGWGYPAWGLGGFGGGFGGGFNGINAIGSAISNQGFVNTGVANNISQISTPTVIW
jgi:hypothetical protein